jgi:hypothetical protein
LPFWTPVRLATFSAKRLDNGEIALCLEREKAVDS